MEEAATLPDGARSRRRALLLASLLGAAVLFGLLLAWMSRGNFTGKYALPTAGAEAPTNPVGPLPPPVGKPVPRAALPPAMPVPVAPPQSPAMIAPSDTAAVDEEDADRIAGAIERTTRKALRRGEPVHWHKAGEEGVVSVSDERDYGDRVCRNVTASITRDDGETSSRSHLWCTEDGDDWTPAG